MRHTVLTFAGIDVFEAEFTRICRELGLHRAIGYLNLRTWHRYTGVYEFRGTTLRCHALFDREDLDVRASSDEALLDTYCGFVARFSTAFATNDSLEDSRLSKHPARAQVRAFHAVPLLDQAERCFGAIAHWDVRPQILHPSEKQLLFTVAPHVADAATEMRRTQEFMVRSVDRSRHTSQRITAP